MPGQPYVSKLSDGRYFAVELPDGSAEPDALTGELILRPPAIRLLDRLRALMSPLPATITAGRLRMLREALGLSREQLAAQLGVEGGKLTEWETGVSRPGTTELNSLESLRSRAVRTGVILQELAQAS